MAVQSKFNYDLPTGITFLLVGLGVGAILALVFSPQIETYTDTSAGRGSRTAANREFSPAL